MQEEHGGCWLKSTAGRFTLAHSEASYHLLTSCVLIPILFLYLIFLPNVVSQTDDLCFQLTPTLWCPLRTVFCIYMSLKLSTNTLLFSWSWDKTHVVTYQGGAIYDLESEQLSLVLLAHTGSISACRIIYFNNAN